MLVENEIKDLVDPPQDVVLRHKGLQIDRLQQPLLVLLLGAADFFTGLAPRMTEIELSWPFCGNIGPTCARTI